MATPAQRELAASIGSLSRWSRVHGKTARRDQLAPARAGRLAKLERQVLDEAGRELTADELAEGVARLRKAHFKRMALASTKARQRNNAA
jgi:hypothetical protein